MLIPNGSSQIALGRDVLAVAVLSIVTTAPLGAVLIAVYGPKLLTRESRVDNSEEGASSL
jgi:hypothetical protein